MSTVKKGDTVAVHYTGTLDDGSVFDSSEGREPLHFQVGSGQVIPGFDSAVIGMSEGDETTVTLAPADAYGEYSEQFVIRANRSDTPPDIVPEIGMELTLHQEDGSQIGVAITEVTDTHVVLDANHPLAGKALTFRIQLVHVH